MNHLSTFPFRKNDQTVSGLLFWLYIYFVIDFFLHFSARYPAYGTIRPTLLVALIIALMLFMQSEKLKGVAQDPTVKALNWLILFLIISLPFVTWPGSVVRANISPFVKAIAFFYFTVFIIDSEKRLKIFLFTFVTCQVFRVLEPLYLNVTEGYWGSQTHLGRGEFAQRLAGAPADIVNPNGLGFVIVTVIPYVHYLLWGSDSKIYKLIYLVIMPPLIYALVLTMSRGAFVALCVVGWMIFKGSNHKISMVLILVVCMSLIWVNLSPLHKDRYLSIFSSETIHHSSAEGRFRGMITEFKIGFERPIVGHGLGTTPEAKVHSGYRRQAAHNLYAELLIEIGLIGFFIYFGYLRSIYRSFKKNQERISLVRINKGSFEYELNNALIAIFWMYVVYSVNYWGLSIYYWYIFGGLTVAFSRIYFSEEKKHAIPIKEVRYK